MVVENSELRLHLVQQFCDTDILLILVKWILFAYIFMQDCLYNYVMLNQEMEHFIYYKIDHNFFA